MTAMLVGDEVLDVRMTEIERRMRDLELAYASSTATVSAKLDGISNQIQATEPRNVDIEHRIRALERARWWAVGFAAAVGAIVGYLAPLLPHGA